MDLRLLNYFVAVYEERNATKAAARCYVSQPSLSNALRQLEDELGTKLFERGSKGMTSTDEADHLYPRARRLLDESRDLSAMSGKNGKDAHRRRHLSGPQSIPDVCGLGKLHLAYPDLNFRMVDHEAISDARITLDVLKREDELFLPLWEEEYALCVRKDHPFAGRNASRRKTSTVNALLSARHVRHISRPSAFWLNPCTGWTFPHAPTTRRRSCIWYRPESTSRSCRPDCWRYLPN